ncbi:MAG TPA: hypothetical protein VH723_01040 [Candidatus Limnocylindrales bacterium]|jgi:hypothetical protein
MVDPMTPETFSAHVGSVFDADGVTLRLVEVRSLGHQPGAPRPHPFALDFTGPREPFLDQRIHRLRHGALGELEIFLVPIGVDADGARYEAVFN